MGLVGCLLGTIGFGIGVLIGLFIGFLLFIYNEPADVKVGTHDKLGMQIVPLRLLIPHKTQESSFNLVKNTNPNDSQNKKRRG
ncbi:hypothetical protein ES288_A04G103800v1 [Gossypium darwinii]|uniref:Uncharacterized protein n=1 Tax=Gossypium darwinii TaxID=34276 RepID=A0A5D2GW99_GOSDA|nr:hypothetical protein ES288_A04G103800v1 [Gossypium darwinii]